MRQKIEKLSTNKSFISALFTFYLLSFPFGASILPVSFGFLTIYPSFVALILLLLIGTSKLSIIQNKYEIGFLLFMVFWWLYAFIFLAFVKDLSNAKIDIRSLTLMLFVSFVVIWIKNFLGLKWFVHQIDWIFKTLFFFLLLVGIVEIHTGIHFTGTFTQKLTHLPIGNVTYSPVFVFDNPNNFFVYLSLIGALALITNTIEKGSILFQYIYILSLIYISFVSSVRAGTMLVFAICAILILFFLLKLLHKKFIQEHKKQLLSVCILSFFMVLAIAKNNLFWGPIWQSAPSVTKKTTNDPNLHGIDERSTYIPIEYVDKLDSALLDTFFHSNKSRLSLFANGIDMMKKSHYLGVGAGQYRHLSATKQKKYYTGTLISPHFWLIEIVSQYGIFILFAYLFFIVLISIKILRFIKNGADETKVLLIGLGSFIVCSILPSSFLILNINWIFFATLVAIVFSLEQLKNESY